jgi:hypothetical protein
MRVCRKACCRSLRTVRQLWTFAVFIRGEFVASDTPAGRSGSSRWRLLFGESVVRAGRAPGRLLGR